MRSACVIRFKRIKRADHWAFFAFRAQPCIQRPDISLGGWLRHGDHKILRGANVFAHKQNVQVRAVADLASPKLSERDDGQLLACEQFRDKNQTRFCDIGKLDKGSCWLDESEYIAKDDAQELSLTVGAYRIEIVCRCA